MMKRRQWTALLMALALVLGISARAEVRLPENARVIKAEAFMNDGSVTEVTLAEGTEEIGDRAFANSGLVSIYIPASAERFGADIFEGCPKELTVLGHRNSAAMAWCVENGIRFKAVEPLMGISLPTSEADYWVKTTREMMEEFNAAGIEADIRHADADQDLQRKQIEAMIEERVNVLVVAALYGAELTDLLAEARSEGIPVIAYERMIYDTPELDGFISFSNQKVGEMQASFVVDACRLDSATTPLNIEFLAGPDTDTNARVFFESAWQVLEPYFRSGRLVTPSGQTAFEDVQVEGWMTERAYDRMADLLRTTYSGGKKPDILLCSNDTTALGAIQALLDAGYTAGDMPVITGQDCDLSNAEYIKNGMQDMSIFKDSRAMAERLTAICGALVRGEAPDFDDEIDNGAIEVPFAISTPVVVTQDNYQEVLVDSGFYEEY